MNLKKTILVSLLLAAIGVVLSGCCSGGECPFKKIFGSESSQSKQPCCPPVDTRMAP